METEAQEQEIGISGLFCFLHQDRMCGPDCMSYTVQQTERSSLNEQQAHCIALLSLERLGRYSGAIMTLLKKGREDSARTVPTNHPKLENL